MCSQNGRCQRRRRGKNYDCMRCNQVFEAMVNAEKSMESNFQGLEGTLIHPQNTFGVGRTRHVPRHGHRCSEADFFESRCPWEFHRRGVEKGRLRACLPGAPLKLHVRLHATPVAQLCHCKRLASEECHLQCVLRRRVVTAMQSPGIAKNILPLFQDREVGRAE